jgi:hypothetical protein
LGPREAGFQEIGDHFDTMSIGRGYWADIPANNSIQLSGLLQEGLIQIPVSFTVDPNNRSASGWNLVGNPYLCPINWDAPTGIIRPNISTSILILDPQTGQQASYNNGIGTLGATAVIPPGQGFWIKAFAHNPQFILDERCKTARSGKLFRGDLPIPQLRFQLYQQRQLWDECVYARRPGAMAGFKNAYDVEFFEAVPEKSKSTPRIWMEDENHFAYSIYNTEQQYPCKICMQIPSAGDWDFQFLALGAMQDFKVADEDNNVLNASQSYRFYAPDSGVYCPYRVLPTHPPDRHPFTDIHIMIYPNPATHNDAIHIQFSGVVPDRGTPLKVIDLHGRTLWQDVFMQNELIIPANIFPVEGMYFLEAALYNTPVMKKILIQGVK